MKLYRRYPIGSLVIRNETPFFEWGIGLLRSYAHVVLYVHQSTYIGIITRKSYVDGSDKGRDKYGNYDCYIIRQSVREHDYIIRVRRNTTCQMFLSSEVVGYCWTASRSYLHLSDIRASSYLHLNKILSGRIRHVYPGLHDNNHDGNDFIGGFVSNTLIENPNVVNNLHDLTAEIK